MSSMISTHPTGTPLKAIATTYNRAHHIFAVFTACAALIVITAGALVTSNDAGLSVPDWPTSFGYLVKVPHFVGGVRFEWTHRMLAGSLLTLTLAIALWTLHCRATALAALAGGGRVLHGHCASHPGRSDRSALSASRRLNGSCRSGPDVLLYCGCDCIVYGPPLGRGTTTSRI